MPKYRRWYRDGGTYFFTVKPYKQQAFLCDTFARTALRLAIEQTRTGKPFEIVGCVLLPNSLKIPVNPYIERLTCKTISQMGNPSS